MSHNIINTFSKVFNYALDFMFSDLVLSIISIIFVLVFVLSIIFGIIDYRNSKINSKGEK